MPIPVPALIAGAGILSSLLKSQRYYPAAEAPSRSQIYGDALGAGIGGLLGGSILGGAGGQQAGGPTILNPPGAVAAGGGIDPQQAALIELLTNGGFAGTGVTGGGGGLDLNQIIGLIGQQQALQQPQAQQLAPTPSPGLFGLGSFV